MLAAPMRPVIGICGAIESARWGVWDAPAVLTPLDYVRAVQEAGRPGGHRAAGSGVRRRCPSSSSTQLDGLILAGGADVDPSFYGAEPHPATTGTAPARDAAEIALAREAIARDMPVLGICRGMQLLNVARGGTLIQHLPESHGHDGHRPNPGSFDGSDHDVRLADGSLAERAAGETVHLTKQHHHQGVDAARAKGWSSPAGRRSTSCPRPSSCRGGGSSSASSGTPRSTRTHG